MEDAVTQVVTQTSPSKTQLGFWLYLMTDCVLFASLFATYAVLRGNTFGGPSGHDIFNLPYVFIETLALLTSSFTCGLAILALRRQKKAQVLTFLSITCALGLMFLGMELSEFTRLALDGNSWERSGFLSSFFTLVGTHGLHIATGLLWLVVLAMQLIKKGFTAGVIRRLTLFSMFWHFLDVVWIFIFTMVYLMGAY